MLFVRDTVEQGQKSNEGGAGCPELEMYILPATFPPEFKFSVCYVHTTVTFHDIVLTVKFGNVYKWYPWSPK